MVAAIPATAVGLAAVKAVPVLVALAPVALAPVVTVKAARALAALAAAGLALVALAKVAKKKAALARAALVPAALARAGLARAGLVLAARVKPALTSSNLDLAAPPRAAPVAVVLEPAAKKPDPVALGKAAAAVRAAATKKPLEPCPLSIEKRQLLESQTCEDLLHPVVRQRANPLTQSRLLHRRDLRHDHDALLRKIALACAEQYVSGLARLLQVRRQRTHDDSRDARVIEDVVLHHNVRM